MGPALFAPLQQVLAKVPPDVDTLIFPNYESLPEREDVADPFTEVTLFKRNYAHVVSGGQKVAFCLCISASHIGTGQLGQLERERCTFAAAPKVAD